MLTVAVIDSYPLILQGLENTLYGSDRGGNMNVILAKNIKDFKKGKNRQKPDLFILGVSEDRAEESLRSLTEMKHDYPASLFIFLDDEICADNALTSFKLGAYGYISKRGNPKELIVCMKSVLAGTRYISSEFRISP